jgi:hypothetical protein
MFFRRDPFIMKGACSTRANEEYEFSTLPETSLLSFKKAERREDFPDPISPVITVRFLEKSIEISFKFG